MTTDGARRAFLGAWLVVVWVALWGDAHIGTVVAGVAVAAAVTWVLALGPRPAARSTIRPVAALRFLLWFVGALVRATALVAWEIVTPKNNLREGIVAIPIRGVSDTVVTVVANAITLTPGTLTLEVQRDPYVLYVHVLHLEGPDQVRNDVLDLEALAIRAFGSADAVAALDERTEAAP